MESTETDKTGIGRDLLTPEQRVMALELALDTLTSQIANQENIISPDLLNIKLLQDQVRLIASQIRSYEKLEALKKIVGMTGMTLQRNSDAPASAKKNDLEATAHLSRAARRRLKRLEAKQMKKNNSAAITSTSLPSDAQADPVFAT